jgi:hypothetical protein
MMAEISSTRDMDYDSSNATSNSPRHFIVLDAIARGMKSVDKIAKAARLPIEEVELIINDLSTQRLIIKEMKKRRFFGTSKLEINVTDTGLKMLNSKKQELHQQAEQLRQWKRGGDTTQLQSYMNSDNNRSWVPFMLFAGIMDMLFFTSIMSMTGMALNPMESQMATDGGGGGTDGAGGAGETDSSGAGVGEADTGGGDFGGFDGGGFGDF